MAKVPVQKSVKTKTKQPVPIEEASRPIRKTKTKAAANTVAQKLAQSKVTRGQTKGKATVSQKTLGLSQVSTASKVSSTKAAAAAVVAKKTKRKVSQESEVQDAPSVQPKRPLTAYVCYTGANFSSYKSKHPDATVPDCMRAIAAAWGTMTDSEKKPYNKLHEADVKRFEKEKSDLDTQGFFINKEGQDSRTLRVKVKRGKVGQQQPAAGANTGA